MQQPVDLRYRLVDDRQRLFDLVSGLIDKAQASERKRRRIVQTFLVDVDDFEATPPRSPASPSAARKPIRIPKAASCASFSPESTSTRAPAAFSAN
ncbi:hypothetical protein GMDG_09020 [Pseudogymnoascus destructans 20631-21]|uniref:Uncharacterized protein n=1 Tax=Pseudogymnoascus destructans (strain ATCC MYA-4855 / 20631-21) TaxID=658429 RepID=L8FTJ2_PSED2|nr:hypothetical protein GMDG_09020 [Pseudogymnoascus destructans 20631-21]